MVNNEDFLRFGRVCNEYYAQPEFIPTESNFAKWIESLDEPMKSGFQKKGFNSCIGVLGYRRFVLEMNGKSMQEYLKHNLSADDFASWNESDT